MTIFEKLSYAGGILTYGIPTFVLPREVVDRALKTLWARGVEIVTDSPVDRTRTVDDPLRRRVRGRLVGSGADVPQVPRGLDTTLTGVWTANDYLTQVNLHSDALPENIRRQAGPGGGGRQRGGGRRPLCPAPGGGDHHGLPPHHRRGPPPAGMRSPTPTRRTSRSRKLTNPVACYGENGVLTGVKCERMVLGEPDDSGRRRPVGTGEFFDVACDNLVIATGTSYSEDVVDTTTGIEKDRWGGIATGEDGATSRPGVLPAVTPSPAPRPWSRPWARGSKPR